jgi:TorA maturation chaperone TorD
MFSFLNKTSKLCFQWIGWLEPLLSRIADDYHHVVYPQIAQISAETLQFKAFAAKDIQKTIVCQYRTEI